MRASAILAFALAILLTACWRGEVRPGASDITGVMPHLTFTMTRANDGATVTGDSYRGKVVLLYFGYTHCPDVCPTTLANLATVLEKLGSRATDVRVLFVSVDPARDTLPVLKAYVSTFAPQIDGLRGADDQIAALARRYRVLYAVTRESGSREPKVMHSDSTFFFDRNGRARLVTTDTRDARAIQADVERLLSG